MVAIASEYQSVSAEVRYLAEKWRNAGELPRIFDGPSRRQNTEKRFVTIKNARLENQPKSIDRNGFELVPFHSPISDFSNSNTIKDKYYQAVSDLIKEHMGADEVWVTQHLIRTEDKSDFNRAYARFIHCDYDTKAAREKSLAMLADKGQNRSDYKDAEFAWYNTWQPFDHPAHHNPLALLDADSIHLEDMGSYLYAGTGKDMESSIPLYNSEHQFYYYSDVTPEEVLLIKQQETRPGRVAVSPHTSFVHPYSSESAPPRRSIEVRMMAVFS